MLDNPGIVRDKAVPDLEVHDPLKVGLWDSNVTIMCSLTLLAIPIKCVFAINELTLLQVASLFIYNWLVNISVY